MHSLRSNWPGARREGGSVSPAILDRLSNEAPGQFQRNPKGGMSFGRRRCCSLLTGPLRDRLWWPCGSTSRLASAQNPLPRTYSYFGDTTLAHFATKRRKNHKRISTSKADEWWRRCSRRGDEADSTGQKISSLRMRAPGSQGCCCQNRPTPVLFEHGALANPFKNGAGPRPRVSSRARRFAGTTVPAPARSIS